MLKFIRNPEIKTALFFSLFLLLLSGGAGSFLFSPKVGLYTSFTALCFILFYLSATCRRYQKIAALSQELDGMLHSQIPVQFEAYAEGELSILQNELSKLTLRLSEQADALLQDKKYLADSLADISHQLRSPLTSIHLVLSLLKDPGLSRERYHELLQELIQLISRIDWLVEALLKMSRMDADTVHLDRMPIPVSRLLENALSPLLIPIELRNQTLHLHAETGREQFLGDLSWTTEALLNMIKNCMEHTPENGELHISCTENTIYTQITVEDNGPGFSEEDLPHLFERFYKGQNAQKQSVGIGLALARMIITRQNGTLKAENRSPNGARFLIKFYK